MTWEELEKKLEYFLDSHNISDKEKKQIITTYKKGYEKDANPVLYYYNFFKCIDYGLGWNGSEKGFDFYYFLQLRWLDYLIKHLPGDLAKKCVYTFKDIVDYAGTEPKWKTWGVSPKKALETKKNMVIMSEYNFKALKKLYENKAIKLLHEIQKGSSERTK